MRFEKTGICLIVLLLMLGFSVKDCHAVETFDIGIQDYNTVSSSNRQFANSIDGTVTGRYLKFDWNGYDGNRIKLWSNNSTIKAALKVRQLKQSSMGFGDFLASIDSAGTLKVHVEDLIMEVSLLCAINADVVIEAAVEFFCDIAVLSSISCSWMFYCYRVFIVWII